MASKALEGTQPALRQSPPIRPLSTSTTGTPKAAAAAATDNPPEPAPITQRSGLSTSTIRSPVILTPTGEPFCRDRNQAHCPQRHQSNQQFWSERCFGIECDP